MTEPREQPELTWDPNVFPNKVFPGAEPLGPPPEVPHHTDEQLILEDVSRLQQELDFANKLLDDLESEVNDPEHSTRSKVLRFRAILKRRYPHKEIN